MHNYKIGSHKSAHVVHLKKAKPKHLKTEAKPQKNFREKQNLKVALVQQQSFANKKESLHQTLVGIKEAKRKGAELVILQELHATHYFCQTEDPSNFSLAESIPGPTTEILSKAAREHKLVIVASVFEKRAPGIYHNTAVVFEKDGKLAGIYRKMHIPDDPGYYEKFYFTPGDQGFSPIQTSVGALGVMVCWDQWFPEGARLMALNGADILIYPTAIGWDPQDTQAEHQIQLDAWITVQRAHAIANGLPVLVCNRVGFEGPTETGIQFWGSSFIAGPQGEMIAQASSKTPAVLYAEISRLKSEKVRCIWPFLRDRRIDAYAGLLKRYLDE